MKTALRVILGLLLMPVILFVSITAALYCPPIQDWAANTAARIATEGTGVNVSVGRVGLGFPLDIDMKRVLATDDEGDTLLAVENLVVDLDMRRILAMQIGLDKVALHAGRVNTKSLIEGLSLNGSIGHFAIASPAGIDLPRGSVAIDGVEADGCDLDIKIGESEPDTAAAEPLPWSVGVGRLRLADTRLRVAMDSLYADMRIAEAKASGIGCLLEQEDYSAKDVCLTGEARVWLPSFSPDTLGVGGIDIAVANMRYAPQKAEVEGLVAQMLHSRLEASLTAAMPLMAFEADVLGVIDRRDLLWGCALLDVDTAVIASLLPPEPLAANIVADGSLGHINIRKAEAVLPNVARVKAEGTAGNVDNLDSLLADIALEAETFDLSRVWRGYRSYLQRACLSGHAKLHGRQYEGKASLKVSGSDLSATANVSASGRDFDVFSPATAITARAEVRRCAFSHSFSHEASDSAAPHRIELNDLCLVASYCQRKASLLLDCNNRLVDGNIGISALVKGRDSVEARFALDLAKLDLYGLRIVQKPLQLGGNIHLDGTSDLKANHSMAGGMTGISLLTADTLYRPMDIMWSACVKRDSLAADVSAGDLMLAFTAGCGIDSLMLKTGQFAAALDEQVRQYRLNQEQLRFMLPKAEVKIQMGRNNPAANLANALGYAFDDFRLRLGANPAVGLNGGMALAKLTKGGVTLDEMWCNIYQDSTGVKIDSRIHNGKKNPKISFDARAKAYVLPTGAGFNVTYIDEKGRKGVDIGSEIDILPDGIRMHLTPLTPIVANRRFEVNDSNFVFMAPDGRVSANLDLLADDGTGMKLYSAEGDSATLQDLTLSVHNVNVAELCSVLPYMPRMSGMLYGDLHFVQTLDNLSVAMDAGVDGMGYEEVPLGHIAINGSYLPMGDSCHYVDAILLREGEEIAALSGTYTDDGRDGQIDAEAGITHLPLEIIGSLAGDPMLFAMGGDVDGGLTVAGSAATPRIDGRIITDGVTIASPAYSVNMRVEDDTVSIRANRLQLNGINMYSTGSTPLVVDGWVDFADPANISLDTRLMARRFELINAKRGTAATAYGKVLVDADATLRGTLQHLALNGRLGVLGGTNVTYVLQDSPLTVEDRLSDLVTFTNFNDTVQAEEEEELPPMALTMTMSVSIDQSAQVHCLLSADRSSYIDIEGGGDLVIGYTPQGDMTLNGRYTIISGEMKYALPVIPLKTFRLQGGSYVAWTGNMMNPKLNISAVERTRATVSTEAGATRSVAFDVGVDISQTLENMGLAFTIEAPEDATIQNELQVMDDAARGRVAVTMLATGMYITDNGSKGGFSTTNAFNSFLQSELMSIAGKALNSIDVGVGVEEGTSAAGTSTTDYSFSFAKRFWNNRISVSFGGRVSSGADARNTGATIIDNVAIEYRLDQSATRYVRLSYDKNYESLLEGTITEMGAGLMLRRKTTRLGELFIFRRKKSNTTQPSLQEERGGVETSAL